MAFVHSENDFPDVKEFSFLSFVSLFSSVIIIHCVRPTGVLQFTTNNRTFLLDFFICAEWNLLGELQITIVIPKLFASFHCLRTFYVSSTTNYLNSTEQAALLSHLLVIHCYRTASLECLVPCEEYPRPKSQSMRFSRERMHWENNRVHKAARLFHA